MFAMFRGLSFAVLTSTILSFTFNSFGLTVHDLQSAFPGQPLYEVDPAAFRQFVTKHSSHGRFVVPSQAASTLPGRSPQTDSIAKVNSIPFVCSSLPEREHVACRDSVESAGSLLRTGPDTLVVGALPDVSENEDRNRGYVGSFFIDMTHSSGDLHMDGGDWAAVIYAVVGVVVVGAFVFYAPYLVYQLIANDGQDPVFNEIGLRYSYSGKAWADGGPPLYRNANLFGLRYAVGLDKGGFGLGLALEGGYINLSLQDVQDPAHAFDFRGGYLVGGPMVRFGNNRPASFTLEFLNGSSDHGSIGWISKSRMTVQGRVGPGSQSGQSGLLVGAHLGAVFYELNFFDGLIQRRGDFNRDLSLIMGLDMGFEF